MAPLLGGNPDLAGRKFLWRTKLLEDGEHVAWRLIEDSDGPAPPLGSDEFGPLPPDLVERPFGGPGAVFPPRPPAAPIASILNT
eukprot:6988680-Alexandrium_andersonii.AAC.1